MWDVAVSSFKLYFVHYLTVLIIFAFLYAFYVDHFQVKKESEIPTGEDLMARYVEARRRGIIK